MTRIKKKEEGHQRPSPHPVIAGQEVKHKVNRFLTTETSQVNNEGSGVQVNK